MVGKIVGFVGSLVLAGILIATSVGLAQGADPWIGTWKLNLAKSTFSPGPAPKSLTLTIEAAAAGAEKHTFDGVNAQGEPTHSERVGKLDGSDTPLLVARPPSNTASTAAYRKLDARSFEVVSKVDGKVVGTTRAVISADGKTMTQNGTGTNAQGQKANYVRVFDRQ